MPACSSNHMRAPLPATNKTLKKKPAILPAEHSVGLLPVNEKTPSITAWLYPSLVLASFLVGILGSYMLWKHNPQSVGADLQASPSSSNTGTNAGDKLDMASLMKQVNPPVGYKLPVRYGALGPELLAAGVIDYESFAAIYANAGNPLTPAQVDVLKRGSNEQIVITDKNAQYLLNFFWAVGLANKNPILTEGPMVKYDGGHIEGFASTGGWTLGAKPVTELYASTDLISLTPQQQVRVEEVAAAVYRPCCDNPTLFPDCNHGMAMLGLLELMASQNASEDEMFQAAKNVNAYWFPQQTLETAIYLKANKGIDFAKADPRMVTSAEFSSGSGAGSIHRKLQIGGLLPQEPGQGGSCGN